MCYGAWASFVKTGDPGWSAYDEGLRLTMLFDETSELRPDAAGRERTAWKGTGAQLRAAPI